MGRRCNSYPNVVERIDPMGSVHVAMGKRRIALGLLAGGTGGDVVLPE